MGNVEVPGNKINTYIGKKKKNILDNVSLIFIIKMLQTMPICLKGSPNISAILGVAMATAVALLATAVSIVYLSDM